MSEERSVKFGKKLLHSLSTGMYENSFFLFREYVQNSADAIEDAIEQGNLDKKDAKILINVDKKSRTIVFRDNGCGVSVENIIDYLINVGDSKKDPSKRMGRFGIGRMGGLGYCKTLKFETSAKGEAKKSIVEWDAQKLESLIVDDQYNEDAIETIKAVVTQRTEKCDEDEHFFMVTMEGIPETHNELLAIDNVRDYLAQVAPVPFDPWTFTHSHDIRKFLESNDISICEYKLELNGDPVYKCYKNKIKNVTRNPSSGRNIGGEDQEISIYGVVCRLLKDPKDGVPRGWYWIAQTDCDGALGKYCLAKCLRLRHWNIQIGEQDCLTGTYFWSEDRGNKYFIGEIHAFDNSLYPNARRDYFEKNESCRLLEKSLKKLFEELYVVYRKASSIHSGNEKVRKAQLLEKEFNERIFAFEEDRKKERAKIAKAKKDSEKALKEREKIVKLIENKGKVGFEPSLSATMLKSILEHNPIPSQSGEIETLPVNATVGSNKETASKKDCTEYNDSNIGTTISETTNSGTVSNGTANSGTTNSGTANSGTANSGTANSETANSETANSGSANSGGTNSGSTNSGGTNSGSTNSGSTNSGSTNSGSTNSGSANGRVKEPSEKEKQVLLIVRDVLQKKLSSAKYNEVWKEITYQFFNIGNSNRGHSEEQ